jgi:hypothetical protein
MGSGGDELKFRAPSKQMPTRNSNCKGHDDDEEKTKSTLKTIIANIDQLLKTTTWVLTNIGIKIITEGSETPGLLL